MQGNKVKVLVIENSKQDAQFLIDVLCESGYEPSYECVESLELFAQALENNSWDVVIADYFMPRFDVLEAFNLLKAKNIDIPFLVVSDKIGEDIVVTAVKCGADDYILKNNLGRLAPAIKRSIQEKQLQRQCRQTEEALKKVRQETAAILNNMKELVAYQDTKNRLIWVNKATADAFNTTAESLAGKVCYEAFHGRSKLCPGCPVVEAVKSGSHQKKEMIGADGRIWQIQGVPVFDLQEKVCGIIEVTSDISERKKLETTLEQIAQEWRVTFDSIQDAVCLLDKDRKIIRANKQMRDFLDKPFTEIIGSYCYDSLIPSASFHKTACPFLKAQETHTRENTIFSHKERWFMVSIDPIFDKEEKFIGAVHIITDITERKEMENKQRLAQLGRLMAEIAHEMNNPLMVISGRAQLLQLEEAQSASIKQNLGLIMKECQRAKGVVERVLKFSKPSHGKFSKININNSIEEIIFLIEHQFSLDGIEIKRRYETNLPLLDADEKQIQEVIINLLTNAHDALHNGGMIEIKTSLSGNCVKAQVIDSGIGMSKEILEKLKDPFFTTKEKGTGLGLGICYNIVRMHGGELKIESESGKGTAVTVVLPVKKEGV